MTAAAIVVVPVEELAGIVERAVASALERVLPQGPEPGPMAKRDAANALGVSCSTLDRWTLLGAPHSMRGKRRVYAVEEVRAWASTDAARRPLPPREPRPEREEQDDDVDVSGAITSLARPRRGGAK